MKETNINTVYPIGVQIEDEIGNSYTEDLPDDIRNGFLQHMLKVNYFCPQMAITLAEKGFLGKTRKAEQGIKDGDAVRSSR
jgi:hypothetical protein